MQTFPLRNQDSETFAFEIVNVVVGRRQVCAVVRRVPGSKVLKTPRLCSWLREDCFCEFTVDGIRYLVEEPFGDNSRYWIGPADGTWHEATEKLRKAFEDHRPAGAYVLTFLTTVGIWGILSVGVLAPLTPSEGYPSILEWLLFGGLPFSGATSLFWRAKWPVAKVLAGAQLFAVVAILALVWSALHTA